MRQLSRDLCTWRKPSSRCAGVIAQNYPVAHLEEALAEGIDVGAEHALVAERSFEPAEIDAIVAYLESIQAPRQVPRASTAAVG